MHLDVITLSRLQFALTIMFHYLFPPMTIGLGVFLVVIEALWLHTKDHFYKNVALFWTRIFGLNFAMGVATGLVMEFQFGTNWANYSRFVGDVFGSALAAEGIFAFFLESGFLAVLVFGWNRVSPRIHFFSTCMVALGSIFSSIWIVIANSFMQTPAGYHLVRTQQGLVRAEIVDFFAMVFNPSSIHRLVHVWIAAFILGAFFIMSVCAYYLLRERHLDFARRCFTIALLYGAFSSCLMLVSGHFQADAVAENQPAKLAALEAHYKTGSGGTEMYLIGWPDNRSETVKLGISVPCLLSILVHGNLTEPVAGLDHFPKDQRPPVLIPFLSYHLMAGLGMMFIALTLIGLFFRWRGSLFQQRWLMLVFVFAVLGAYAANESGWVAAETARQPYVVYHLMRTRDAVSPVVSSQHVIASILMFGFVYAMLFAAFVHVLNDKIQAGPVALEERSEELDREMMPESEEAAAAEKVISGDEKIESLSTSFFKLAGKALRRGNLGFMTGARFGAAASLSERQPESQQLPDSSRTQNDEEGGAI